MKLTRLRFVFTGIVILFLYGCATNYTIQLLDEENQLPVSGIQIEILDENGEDQLMLDESNADGQFEFDLNKIPGDSFLIAIAGEEYFEKKEWINTPNKSANKALVLEKRITIIIGYVIDADDENYSGIPNCEITTMPAISQKVFTGKDGKFVIKSDEFAESVSYTIFATKQDYTESSTDITPHINKETNLENAIFLKRAEREDVVIEGPEKPEVLEDPAPPTN